MDLNYGVLCDPDEPIEHGSRVLAALPDGSRFDCTVITKHPARAKALKLQMLHGGAVVQGATLRSVRKEWVTRVMSISGRAP